jgi:hypothetical protein
MAGSGKTQRFILRRKPSATPSGVVLPDELGSLKGVTIIESSPRMVLVDAPAKVLERAMQEFSDWMVIPETFTPVPDTRPKLKHP